jgi:drug/metabolite transporter (DMT)-like permease
VVYAFGLLAACLLGLGFVLQQHAAERAPLSDMLSFRLLLDLIRVPLWLGGIGCMVLGQILGALALTVGDLSRVEPLLATNLLFAMALARWFSGQALGWTGWAGVLALSGGVAVFIVAGRPQQSSQPVGPVRYWLVLALLLGIAGAFVLAALAVDLVHRPALLAPSAGVLYGVQDALTRASGTIASHHGVVRLLASWQPWALVALAIVGLMLVQSAFEAGPLRESLPPLTAAEPLAGIACGIGLFGDTLASTPGALAWQSAAVIAVVSGVFLLGRHPAMPAGRREQAAADTR